MAGTWYADTMVLDCPGVIEPSAHGNAVAQSPVFPRKVSPFGVGSATLTPAAVDGPLLVTVIENVTVSPGTTVACPDFRIERSANGELSAVATVAVLLAGLESPVVANTDAVFTIGFGAV